jgi:hypothetical protein
MGDEAEYLIDREMFDGIDSTGEPIDFSARKAARILSKQNRRAKAAADFPEAQRRAAAISLTLKRHTDVHYQLCGPGWIINVYPGKQRIWGPKTDKSPYLKLPADWGLLDVVGAAEGLKP